jgi:hypothetical protein
MQKRRNSTPLLVEAHLWAHKNATHYSTNVRIVKSALTECVEKVGLSLCLDWRVYSSWVIIRLNSFRTLIQIGESYLGPQTTV